MLDALLEELARQRDSRYPLAQWQPAHSGHIDIRIDSHGRWFHEGSEIRREAIVRLLAAVLRKDPDGYCLVTPSERWLIAVEDVPFIAHLERVTGEGQAADIYLRSNTGDLCRLDAAHPLVLRGEGSGRRPYVQLRDGLEARLARPAYYQLMGMAIEQDGGWYLYSGGTAFLLDSDPA